MLLIAKAKQRKTMQSLSITKDQIIAEAITLNYKRIEKRKKIGLLLMLNEAILGDYYRLLFYYTNNFISQVRLLEDVNKKAKIIVIIQNQNQAARAAKRNKLQPNEYKRKRIKIIK